MLCALIRLVIGYSRAARVGRHELPLIACGVRHPRMPLAETPPSIVVGGA